MTYVAIETKLNVAILNGCCDFMTLFLQKLSGTAKDKRPTFLDNGKTAEHGNGQIDFLLIVVACEGSARLI